MIRMVLTFAVILTCFAQGNAPPRDEAFTGFEWVDLKLKIDWAQTYVSTKPGLQFKIQLHGSGRFYTVTGTWRKDKATPQTISGSFTQLVGRERGPIELHCSDHQWSG